MALLCNVARSPFAWIPRLVGRPTVLNVDGLDRKRKKWNVAGQAYLFVGEILALLPPTRLVTDADVIPCYYRQRYGKRSSMITHGAEAIVIPCAEELEGLKLPQGKYFLYVSRLEPENHEVVAHAGLPFSASEEDSAEKMEQVLQQPDWRQRLQTQAQSGAQACYRWDEVAAQYEKLIA